MKSDTVGVGTTSSWRAQAAYFYVLDLDGPALAWEYLRRNAAYRMAWMNRGRGVDGAPWGLRSC